MQCFFSFETGLGRLAETSEDRFLMVLSLGYEASGLGLEGCGFGLSLEASGLVNNPATM